MSSKLEQLGAKNTRAQLAASSWLVAREVQEGLGVDAEIAFALAHRANADHAELPAQAMWWLP